MVAVEKESQNQPQSQSKLIKSSVTPSPVAASSTNKFSFVNEASPSLSSLLSSKTNSLPSGVVDLYNDKNSNSNNVGTNVGTTTIAGRFDSPTNPPLRSSSSSSKKRKAQRQALQSRCDSNSNGKARSSLMFGSLASFDSCTPESLTAEYVRSYGQDHWKALHEAERPIIYDPAALALLTSNNADADGKKDKDRTKKRRGNDVPFGTPQSASSTSSSSSLAESSVLSTWTGGTTRVTPNEDYYEETHPDAWVPTNFNRIQQNLPREPHKSAENNKPMSIQPQLTPKMRSILVDWMIELSEHFSFSSLTLHLAITMVDRVLASGRFWKDQNNNDANRNTNTNSNTNAKNKTSSSATKNTAKNSNSNSNTSTIERRRTRSHTFSSRDDSHDTNANNNKSDSDQHETEDDDDTVNDDDDDIDDDDEDDSKSKDTRCYVIPRNRFQLLGATCVWLACKVQEITPPKASEIAYVSDHIYNTDQIIRMERRVCNALDFNFFTAPTPHQFLFEFTRASLVGCCPRHVQQLKQQQNQLVEKTGNTATATVSANATACACGCRRCRIPAAYVGVGLATNSIFRDMVHYLLELGRLPYGPACRNPSLLAAAAVYLARVTLGIPRTLEATTKATTIEKSSSSSSVAGATACGDGDDSDGNNNSKSSNYYNWTPTLQHYTGYKMAELRETVLEIHGYLMAAETSGLKATFNKYKSKKYHRVALKTVLRAEELGFV